MSFEKLAAIYVYCADYHDGQWSREYALSCRIQRQYRIKLNDSAWDEAREHDVYKSLESKYQKT
jgi:hypothetical protein